MKPRVFIPTLMLLLSLVAPLRGQDGSACTRPTSAGTDFWVTFHINAEKRSQHTFNRAYLSLFATGDQNATITVSNNRTGYSQTFTHTAGTKTIIALPDHWDTASAVPATMGYHVTSTAPVFLYASNFWKDSWDVCNVLPSRALGTNYIVQDYSHSNSPFAPVVSMVATEDNTTVSMVLPCQVEGTSTPVGGTFTVTLNQGQSLMLRGRTTTTFCGMPVTANKPIALFQGHSCGLVGNVNGGRDMMFENAWPVEMWGTEFVFTSTTSRTEGDQLIITSAQNGCHVEINGSTAANMNAGESYVHIMPANSSCHIVTSKPSYVAMYPWSYTNSSTLGDPAQIPVIPVDRWICNANVPIHNCNTNTYDQQYIADNHHYIDIVATDDAVDSIMLNGVPMSGFTSIGNGFSHKVMTAPPGVYNFTTSQGTFTARAYGLGMWVCYGYSAGLYAEPTVYDTVDVYDTICQGQPYDSLGVQLQPIHTQTVGTLLYSNTVYNDTACIHYVLHITVMPAAQAELHDTIMCGETVAFGDMILSESGDYQMSFATGAGCDSTVTLHLAVLSLAAVEETRYIVAGDTLAVCDTLLTTAGDYTFSGTNANGCDTVYILHLLYETMGLTASSYGGCPGDEVVITATGTHVFNWAAEPPDSELDGQQGVNPITVHPRQTTVYSLLDAAGNVLKSLTVNVDNPSRPCVECNRQLLDFDNPTLVFTDCTEGHHHTSWEFADSITLNGERIRRHFQHPLPDSVEVTMISCTRYDCCVDTTLRLPMKIRSVWFPNVFTPGAESNNLFGCYTSHEVAVFELVIYDRWGILIWTSDDVAVGWDGRCTDGTPCPQGAYAYRYYLKATDGTVSHGIGTVTLLR